MALIPVSGSVAVTCNTDFPWNTVKENCCQHYILTDSYLLRLDFCHMLPGSFFDYVFYWYLIYSFCLHPNLNESINEIQKTRQFGLIGRSDRSISAHLRRILGHVPSIGEASEYRVNIWSVFNCDERIDIVCLVVDLIRKTLASMILWMKNIV